MNGDAAYLSIRGVLYAVLGIGNRVRNISKNEKYDRFFDFSKMHATIGGVAAFGCFFFTDEVPQLSNYPGTFGSKTGDVTSASPEWEKACWMYREA